ncbi:MAG TPA: SGNH/GDSL hydrolase family protein [Verrucomicrobiae bacterium]|nr:SGNH/GDSL hydrolase family protein [Verrucomicrobiae bacterium]
MKMDEKRPLRWYSFRWQTGLALCLVAFVAWYYLIGRFKHPVGTGPAGPAVSASAFQTVWSTNQFVLIGIGDSVTAGFGATRKHSYFDLLQQNDDALYPDMAGKDLRHVLPNLMVHNLSVSYTVSEEHLRDQVPLVATYPPTVRGIIVITTGGNDLIHDYGRSAPRDGAMYGCTYDQAVNWKGSFHKRLQGILDGVIARFPGGCDVFLANIYDPTDDVGDIEHAHLALPSWRDGTKVLPLFNDLIADTCRSYTNAHLVDIHGAFLGHGIHCADRHNAHYRGDDPHYWYFENLEDPNDRGYDAIRRLFLVEMGKVFSRG